MDHFTRQRHGIIGGFYRSGFAFANKRNSRAEGERKSCFLRGGQLDDHHLVRIAGEIFTAVLNVALGVFDERKSSIEIECAFVLANTAMIKIEVNFGKVIQSPSIQPTVFTRVVKAVFGDLKTLGIDATKHIDAHVPVSKWKRIVDPPKVAVGSRFVVLQD